MKYVIRKTAEGKIEEVYGVVDETASVYMTQANWVTQPDKKTQIEAGIAYSHVFSKAEITADPLLIVEESIKA